MIDPLPWPNHLTKPTRGKPPQLTTMTPIMYDEPYVPHVPVGLPHCCIVMWLWGNNVRKSLRWTNHLKVFKSVFKVFKSVSKCLVHISKCLVYISKCLVYSRKCLVHTSKCLVYSKVTNLSFKMFSLFIKAFSLYLKVFSPYFKMFSLFQSD